MKYLLLILILASGLVSMHHPAPDSGNRMVFTKDTLYSEYPHVFLQGNQYIVRWIENGTAQHKELSRADSGFFLKKWRLNVTPEVFRKKSGRVPDFKQQFTGIDKFVAISDIHGQYDLFVQLLRQHEVIDSNNNWQYGKGHLVFNGDIFDRGDKVTEALWLVYVLEEQALAAGGKVHYLLGNHELMNFDNDLRYLNSKYTELSNQLQLPHQSLYSSQTVIGNWLLAKPVIITINDVLFTHAGISPEFIQQKFSAAEVNQLFAEKISGAGKDHYRKDSVLNFLSRSSGPLWYRGYFKTPVLDEEEITKTLKHFNVRHIVVGHTTMQEITVLYQGKVFAIDSGIKDGKTGQVLIYEKGRFYKGLLTGERINF